MSDSIISNVFDNGNDACFLELFRMDCFFYFNDLFNILALIVFKFNFLNVSIEFSSL